MIVVVDEGKISDIRYAGTDLRLFEKLWTGMNVDELPRIVPMICGVCSASHHVCSAKAVDGVRGAEPPETAIRVREVINMALHLNNQALHLFAIGLPSLSEKLPKGLPVLASTYKELVGNGLRITKLGLDIVEVFGGKRIHPVTCYVGGVRRVPTKEEIDKVITKLAESEKVVKDFINECMTYAVNYKDLVDKYKLTTNYYIAVTNDGKYEFTYGKANLYSDGSVVTEVSANYREVLKEKTVSYSYVKHVYYGEKPVFTGSLARFLATKDYGSPLAGEARDRVRNEVGMKLSPIMYHFARIIEVAANYENLLATLKEGFTDEIFREPSKESGEGLGIIEAPRGTLIHHYAAENLETKWVNIITPTTISAAAIESDLRNALQGERFDKELVNKVITTIVPAYDPCMSCATHAMQVEVVGNVRT